MKAKLLALIATLLTGALGAMQPANAAITNGVWIGWYAGEFFQVHCQARNTQTTDYVHWWHYAINTCLIQATWGYSYFDQNDDSGSVVFVPKHGTSVSNVVVQLPYACPAALFAVNDVAAYNLVNEQFYHVVNYDGDEAGCGDPW